MSDPRMYPQARSYLEAANERRLIVPRCLDCEAHFFPPRVVCPYCLGDDVEFAESDGRGTLYSYSVVRTEGHPDRGSDAPYPIALVALDDGPIMFSTVVDCAIADLAVDMVLAVDFEALSGAQLYPVFRPDSAAEA